MDTLEFKTKYALSLKEFLLTTEWGKGQIQLTRITPSGPRLMGVLRSIFEGGDRMGVERPDCGPMPYTTNRAIRSISISLDYPAKVCLLVDSSTGAVVPDLDIAWPGKTYFEGEYRGNHSG